MIGLYEAFVEPGWRGVCARMVAMSRRLSQLWSNEPFRRSLIAAVRLWNSAVKASLPQQIQAAGQLEKICEQCGASPGSSAADAETPSQTIDRLLDFPSRRLAVYGSLAPGKKNHHVMAGMQGTWRTAVLRGSLLNQGWGADQGFRAFYGTDPKRPSPRRCSRRPICRGIGSAWTNLKARNISASWSRWRRKTERLRCAMCMSWQKTLPRMNTNDTDKGHCRN